MDRRRFFKLLGLGAAAPLVAKALPVETQPVKKIEILRGGEVLSGPTSGPAFIDWGFAYFHRRAGDYKFYKVRIYKNPVGHKWKLEWMPKVPTVQALFLAHEIINLTEGKVYKSCYGAPLRIAIDVEFPVPTFKTTYPIELYLEPYEQLVHTDVYDMLKQEGIPHYRVGDDGLYYPRPSHLDL